ncbi:Uncharacterized protein C4orf19, partial [Buceros rhinoceros silvestris]
MGCRCCKMIQSYIFDPEEVRSPGCIHEVNSYKHNEQGSNESKFKENSEIQEHNNELQKDELNRTENKNQVNSTKTPWNHGDNDFQEDGLVKCVAKPDVAVNGGNSCTPGICSVLNPSTNIVKEASEQGTSSHSEASSDSNRDFHNKANSIQDENPNSAEDSIFLKGSAILETQNHAIQLPDADYPQNGNQTRNYVGKDSFSVHCAHSDQNAGHSAIENQDLCVAPPSPMKQSSIEPFKTASTCLSKGITGGTIAVAVSRAAEALTYPNCKDMNGETEKEDAEVAAALAALEAATAGEDLEDDD